MKEFRSKRMITLVIAVVFIFAACSQIGTNHTTDSAVAGTGTDGEMISPDNAEAGTEVYKVDVFTMLGNYAGMQTGWFAKIVKDQFNMEFNMIASNIDGGGEVKFASMIASGDLGDLVIFGNDDSKFYDSISGGFLLDMTRNGLLDQYGQEIVVNYPKVIQKSKVNYGSGIGVYGLGFNAANMPNGPSEGEEMTWGPDLRWDLYTMLGYPRIDIMEDYLPVLKQMQMLEPRSESGRPTYGFSLWSDWDGDKMCLAKQYANVYGYDESDGYNPYGYALVSAAGDQYQSLLDPDSFYIKCLKLYFNANQMGLMDPDSISQKYEDVNSKFMDGQVLFSWFPWMDNIYNTQERQEQGKGFRLVPFTEEVVYSTGYNPYGGNRLISIGVGAEYPERIMQLINWMYSPEGFQTIKTGPKGLTWDTNAQGKPYLTAFGKKALPNNTEPVPEEYGGGTFKDGQNQMNIDPIHQTAINPVTGEAYDYHLWNSYLRDNPTRLVSDWRRKMGVLTAREYFEKNGLIAVVEPLFTGKAPENMDKTLEKKKGQVSAIIRQYSWEMVFARNQTDFNSLHENMVTKAKSLGYDDILKWNIEQAQKVYEWRKSNQNRQNN